MADDEDIKEYRWETGYEKTWEVIQEDDRGNLEASVADIIQQAKRKTQNERKGHTRLGMMRHMYIILDTSEAMLDQDLKPTRQLCTLKLLESFVEEYLYENPLSQLGFIITRNKRAEKITELSGNYKKQLESLKANFGQHNSCSGEPSLQNALELALSSLKHMPSHAIREILVIMGSLTTCDPGDISVTIQKLKSASIRSSLIGLSADVRLFKSLCMTTAGDYGIALDDVHFKHLLSTHSLPPQAAAEHSSSALVKMGFPHHAATDDKKTYLAMCMCHLDNEDESKLDAGGHLCPQCRCKYCELPVECKVCGLTLVSAPHLARSYHHLFPVQPFIQIPIEQNQVPSCFSCRAPFKQLDKQVYKCEQCYETYCLDCDMFIHDTLHSCPGCSTNQHTYQSISGDS